MQDSGQPEVERHADRSIELRVNQIMVKLGFVEFAAIVLAAAVLSPGVMAQPPSDTGTATLYQGAYSYDVGGEFTAVTAPNLASGYASGLVLTPTVKGLTGFQTFCIQTAVDFTPGTTYNYSTSLASVGSPDAFALKEGTAWLYGEFATGNLGSYYNYANTGTGPSRLVDAGLLQAAIWALQGGQAYSDGNYASLASRKPQTLTICSPRARWAPISKPMSPPPTTRNLALKFSICIAAAHRPQARPKTNWSTWAVQRN